jgi:anti-sigma regulatory factor (Ser/Thr protein kinase)
VLILIAHQAGDKAMTSTAAAGQRGFRHELLLHRSTDELLEFVVPMAREGVAAQEPTLLLVRPDTAEAVLDQVGPSPYLTVQPALAQPGRPALHVRAAGPMLAGYARVIHQEPVIPPSQWPEWRRLEAVLNLALSHHDTWTVCAYDRRTLTDEMVADLHATHPLIAEGGSDQRSDRYQHPVDFLKHQRNNPADPVERTTPAVELVDPSPATARATVAGFARHERLPTAEIDNLVFATNEAVTNALMHGRPPTLLRLWAQPGRVTVTVTDTGPGPSDPLVGLLLPGPCPGPGSGPRLGLWLSHQLVDVAHRHHRDGYTIRLAAAHPVDHTV